MSKPDLILEPYYTSMLATLVCPDGYLAHLGELPKFVERTLGIGWHDYLSECERVHSAERPATETMARVLVRYMREHAGFTRNRQVYMELKKYEAWELWA